MILDAAGKAPSAAIDPGLVAAIVAAAVAVTLFVLERVWSQYLAWRSREREAIESIAEACFGIVDGTFMDGKRYSPDRWRELIHAMAIADIRVTRTDEVGELITQAIRLGRTIADSPSSDDEVRVETAALLDGVRNALVAWHRFRLRSSRLLRTALPSTLASADTR